MRQLCEEKNCYCVWICALFVLAFRVARVSILNFAEHDCNVLLARNVKKIITLASSPPMMAAALIHLGDLICSYLALSRSFVCMQ